MSSTGRAQIESLQTLLDRDLDYVCENLRGEFSKMAGRRVLMTGGAGFLGYYMVQSLLWSAALVAIFAPLAVARFRRV